MIQAVFVYRKYCPCFRHSAHGGSEIFKEVIDADDQYYDNQDTEQPVYLPAVQLFVENTSQSGACNTGRNHTEQKPPGEVGDGSGGDRLQKGGNLGKHDDQQRILRRCLRVHGEKVGQENQIEGTASDAQEGGEKAENDADQDAGQRIGKLPGADRGLFKCIKKCSQCQDEQNGSLVGADPVWIGAGILDQRKGLLSNHPSGYSACREQDAGTRVETYFPGQHGFDDRIDRHAHDHQAGQKADGFHTHDSHTVQNRLDNYASADSADGTDDGSAETDTYNNAVEKHSPNLPIFLFIFQSAEGGESRLLRTAFKII